MPVRPCLWSLITSVLCLSLHLDKFCSCRADSRYLGHHPSSSWQHFSIQSLPLARITWWIHLAAHSNAQEVLNLYINLGRIMCLHHQLVQFWAQACHLSKTLLMLAHRSYAFLHKVLIHLFISSIPPTQDNWALGASLFSSVKWECTCVKP